MAVASRPTGIEALGAMPWGSHLGLFYETFQDWLEILAPYVRAGLALRDYCLIIPPPFLTSEDARRALAAALPDLESALGAGQIEIVPHTAWYWAEGQFDARQATQSLLDRLERARRLGLAGLRMMADSSWLTHDQWASFAAYEAGTTELLGGLPVLALCTYALDRCQPAEVLDVISGHAVTVVRRRGVWRRLESSGLQRAHDQALNLKLDLERRVARRTAQLGAANELLKTEVAERQRAEDVLRGEAGRAEALARVGQLLNAELDLDAVIRAVCLEATRVLNVPFCTVALFDPAQAAFVYAGGIGVPPGLLPLMQPLSRALWASLLPAADPLIIVPDVQAVPHLASAAFHRALDLRTLVLATLFHVGQPLAVLIVASLGQPRVFDANELRFLRGLAEQAALAIQNARLFRSVSEHRERLRALSTQLVQVQEAERRHIARELHDEVGQLLTGVQVTLAMSGRQAPADTRAGLAQAQALIGQLIDRVQDLSLDLRPAMLDDFGLVPTLLWHFDRYRQQTGIQVLFEHRGADRRFSPEVETVVYRTVQEALTNSARHSGVRQVAVRLWGEQTVLSVQIEDEGAGFDVWEPAGPTAIGLSGMQERAELLGGRLTIASAPGAGTQVTAELPLADRLEPTPP